VADPELSRRIRRIEAIRIELIELHHEIHPRATLSTIGLWCASVTLCIAGLVLTPPTGGISLVLSVGGVLLLMIDTARQIQSAARSSEQRQHAERLEEELRDHLAFIQRFGKLS
jgi:cytochrome c-type biogenesis protein CcmH/NrfF